MTDSMRDVNNLHRLIIFPETDFKRLEEHLLPVNMEFEECGFLFLRRQIEGKLIRYIHKDTYLLKKKDFVFQSKYHFEVKDEIRAKMIKIAHDGDFILAEAHSHVTSASAEFSQTDWDGFNDFVPHVRWRLKSKPYIALVFTLTGFDCLLWEDNTPLGIDGIRVNGKFIEPSNKSITNYKWNESMNDR